MADEKPPSKKPSSDGGEKEHLGIVIFILILLFAVGGAYSTKEIFSDKENYTNEETGYFSPTKILSPGNVALGKKVINKTLVEIRQSAAGSIIGEQSKRAIGIIKEGPVESFGKKWWRVDYDKAPDGWVTEEDLTTKIGSFRFINIIPILYDFLKPILWVISLILVVILLAIKLLQNKADEIENKKAELKRKQRSGYIEEVVDNKREATFPNNLPTGDDVPVFQEKTEQVKNERWEHVQKLIDSRNESDWRQSIMEADIILDAMLDRIGYEGESVGEKLKKIEESDFLTLSKAWEAHRVRNKIAHGGINFYLTKNEAERVIKLYKQVFEEFYYI